MPHFAVIRMDRPSTKTRIVFDASAKYCRVSLNNYAIHQGPKLQQELFTVLIHFRKYPVALVCDIAEMYLRIEHYPQDRMFHRLLWRDLENYQKPIEYEFNRLVFGVNSSPFCLNWCHIIMPEFTRKFIQNPQKPYCSLFTWMIVWTLF